MPKGHTRTDAEWARAKRVLGKHHTISAAAAELGMAHSALDQWCRRRGERAGALLAKAPDAAAVVVEHRAAADKREAKRRERLLVERVSALEAELSDYRDVLAAPIAPVTLRKLRTGYKRRAAAVTLLSDVHHEEIVTPGDVIRNEHNRAVSRARLGRYFRGVEWLLHNAHAGWWDVQTLVFWLGGDFISGHIHPELVEATDCAPVEAILSVRDVVIAGVRGWRAAFPETQIVIPYSDGNHDRITDKPRATTGHGHSLGRVLATSVAEAFADDPLVIVHAPAEELCYLDVHGYTLGFHHGHRIKYSGGIGGVSIPLIKAMHRWRTWRQCEYFHIGHYHQLKDFGDVMVNGSVIGPNAYALSIGATPEPPRQGFYLLDEKRGKTHVCPVWCAE